MMPERDRPTGEPARLRFRSSPTTAAAPMTASRLASVAVLAAAMAILLAVLSIGSVPARAVDAAATPTFAAIVTPGPFGTAATPTATPFPSRHATRVKIPYLRIDNRVVKSPPKGVYPYCNVAMYLPTLGQPGWGNTTFIFAHARVGMFLNMLKASKINNGAAMVGKTVYVYTNDNWRWQYQITKVYRHQTDMHILKYITGEALVLQTSEGPRGTLQKLLVKSKYIGRVKVSYSAAHPLTRVVVCG